MKSIIAVVSLNRAPWGGSEDVWKKIIIDLDRLGHKVLAVFYSNRAKSKKISTIKSESIQFLERPTYHYQNLTNLLRLYKTYQAFKQLGTPSSKFWQRVLKENPDHIIFNLGEALEPDLVPHLPLFKYLLRKRIPYTLVVHFTPNYNAPLTAGERKNFTLIYQGAYKLIFVAKPNALATFRLLQIRAIPYQILKGQVLPITNFPASRISQNIELAAVARLEHDVKGQDLLLERLAHCPHKNCITLNFYGSGPSKDYLQKLINFYGLQQNAYLHGFKPIDDIWAQNHLLVLASKDEGMPLAALEAMARSRSFISSPAGGMAELTEEIGWLCSFKSQAEFDALIEQIISHKSLIAQKANRAKTWLEKEYATEFEMVTNLF